MHREFSTFESLIEQAQNLIFILLRQCMVACHFAAHLHRCPLRVGAADDHGYGVEHSRMQ